MITRNFKLFLTAGRSIPLLINANQYDHGETWIFTLYDETGQKYTPSSGGIVGIKSDGYVIADTGTVNSAGQVVIIESEQMTAAAGKAIYELVIDDQTHGTANFCLMVEPKPGVGGIVSDSDLALIQQALDSTNPEAIAQGVSDWMDENLAPEEWVIDSSLSVAGAAADAKKTGDEISDLKSQINNSMPQEVKLALDAMLLNMVVKDDDVFRDEYNTIHAWATAVTLNSISATFNQGDNVIFRIDSLDTLKQYLTVTANYSDGTSATITSYELSGTLTAGESTITATYSGKSASFTANVTEGTDVTPALSGFTAGSGTQVTYNSSDESLNVKTTTNSTYLSAGAGSDLTFKTGYTYRLLFDVVAVSGTANHMLAFRNSSSQIVTETRTEFASVGTYQKDVILSECVRLEGQTTCRLFVFAAANTSGNGDVTIKNLKLIEYLAGE